MKLNELLDKYGNFEVDSKVEDKIKNIFVNNCQIGNGDNCYIVNHYNKIEPYVFNCDSVLQQFYKNLNRVYKTREECERYLEIHKAFKEMSFEPDWGDDTQEKWHIYYNNQQDKIKTECYSIIQYPVQYYFESEVTIDYLVERFGKDDIKKYIFGIED